MAGSKKLSIRMGASMGSTEPCERASDARAARREKRDAKRKGVPTMMLQDVTKTLRDVSDASRTVAGHFRIERSGAGPGKASGDAYQTSCPAGSSDLQRPGGASSSAVSRRRWRAAEMRSRALSSPSAASMVTSSLSPPLTS